MRTWVQESVDGLGPKRTVRFEAAVEAIEKWRALPFSASMVWVAGYPARYHDIVLAVHWLADLGKVECVQRTSDDRCFLWRWVV